MNSWCRCRGHAAAEHRAVQDVERGEQRGGAVADIVVGHRPGLAGLERQTRLGAVQGLDLALLVDREHDRMARGRQVQPDDVRELGDELGITAALEAAQAVGLQPVGRPDPLHGPQGQAGGLGHHPAGPVGRLAGRLAAGQRHHALHGRLGRRRLAGLSGLVVQQPVDAGLGEALLPAPHRRPADPGAPGDLRHVQPLGRVQDDPGPRHMLLRPVAIGQDRRQALAILGRDKGTDRLCHAQTHSTAACKCESYECVSALEAGAGLKPLNSVRTSKTRHASPQQGATLTLVPRAPCAAMQITAMFDVADTYR